ncbi:hypothetical protein PG993_015127 [Apiospora rasikravindrae]|uniref:Uncharacterized protein n=1 Tax=Apiospora rasikravindrae TaxID=990691 RepID=A0ABR1RRU0_9PEZI
MIPYLKYLSHFEPTGNHSTDSAVRLYCHRDRSTPIGVRFVPSLPDAEAHEGPATAHIAERWHHEAQHLDVLTLRVEPGRFRTKRLSAGNMQAATSKFAEGAWNLCRGSSNA